MKKLLTYVDVNSKMHTKEGYPREIFHGLTPKNSYRFFWSVVIPKVGETGRLMQIPRPKTRRKVRDILKRLTKSIRDDLIIQLQIRK